MPRPNLFDHATSELSQDAILCWLLEWAHVQHLSGGSALDQQLQQTGRAFLDALFDAARVERISGDVTVDVKRQLFHTDVAARVGDKHLVIIEDKVHTATHSGQLKRYTDAMKEHGEGRTLVRVLLKTGDQARYGKAIADGWGVMTRPDLLKVLRAGPKGNAILDDFVLRLEHLEREVGEYLTKPIGDWTDPNSAAYKGLFAALLPRLRSPTACAPPNWDYVANPNGGFLGFWWGEVTTPDGDGVYLQLEGPKLVIKIGVDDKDKQSRHRNEAWRRFRASLPSDKFNKPKSFGKGRYMTVAEASFSYRGEDPEALLELESVAEQLRHWERRVAEFVAQW